MTGPVSQNNLSAFPELTRDEVAQIKLLSKSQSLLAGDILFRVGDFEIDLVAALFLFSSVQMLVLIGFLRESSGTRMDI